MSFTRIWRTDKEDNVVRNVLENNLNQLTDRQRLIYNRLIETGTITTIDDVVRNNKNVVRNVVRNYTENSKSLSVFLTVNERTIQRDLATLQTKGILFHEGSTKAGYWEIKVFKK